MFIRSIFYSTDRQTWVAFSRIDRVRPNRIRNRNRINIHCLCDSLIILVSDVCSLYAIEYALMCWYTIILYREAHTTEQSTCVHVIVCVLVSIEEREKKVERVLHTRTHYSEFLTDSGWRRCWSMHAYKHIATTWALRYIRKLLKFKRISMVV